MLSTLEARPLTLSPLATCVWLGLLRRNITIFGEVKQKYKEARIMRLGGGRSTPATRALPMGITALTTV